MRASLLIHSEVLAFSYYYYIGSCIKCRPAERLDAELFTYIDRGRHGLYISRALAFITIYVRIIGIFRRIPHRRLRELSANTSFDALAAFLFDARFSLPSA